MQKLTDDDALYAAAYRVAYERIMPDQCVNDVMLTVAERVADEILAWSSGLSARVVAAYRRAVADPSPDVGVLARARIRVENADRARRMTAEYEAIAKPPESMSVRPPPPPGPPPMLLRYPTAPNGGQGL